MQQSHLSSTAILSSTIDVSVPTPSSTSEHRDKILGGPLHEPSLTLEAAVVESQLEAAVVESQSPAGPSTLEAAIVVVIVVLRLFVVNWSGDQVAQLEVKPSETVLVGMRQVEDQLGVPVPRQVLICGEDMLEAGQTWSSYGSVRDWSTIQLTTITQGADYDAASDREALMALTDNGWRSDFRLSVNEDGRHVTNWGSTEPVSSWAGVKVDEESRVTSLNLRFPRYAKAPDQLHRLTALTRLILTGNMFLGDGFRLDICQLTRLSLLSMSDCELGGEIPPEVGQLTNLYFLNIGWNRLTGAIPPAIGNLTALTELNLCNNHLRGPIPPAISRLTNLTALRLSDNQLSGEIPSDLGQLTALKVLFLADNHLRGPIPPAIGHITSLRRLYLCRNHLTGEIPVELSCLTNLLHLGLEDNQLTGIISRDLFNQYPMMCRVSLNGNQLSF